MTNEKRLTNGQKDPLKPFNYNFNMLIKLETKYL